MIGDADGGLKDKAGRLAYVWTGARNVGAPRVATRVRVDGSSFFKGKVSCVLIGNVGTITGGLRPFDGAAPDDGVLEVGVVTAKGAVQWSRVLARLAAGKASTSPFTRQTSGRKIDVKFAKKVHYELDGGARGTTTKVEGACSSRRDHRVRPRGRPMSTATRGARDVGALRRRRLEDTAADGAGAVAP